MMARRGCGRTARLLAWVLLAWCAAGTAAPAGDAPSPLPEWIEPVTGMVFLEVPAGRFVMGSPPGEVGREAQERRHPVLLSHPFALGKYEVTQGEWSKVMGSNPSRFQGCGPDCPVEEVSWYEVREFARRLGELSPGSRFRLPTEAEWEYACRAGTTTAYGTGETLSPDQANFRTGPPEAPDPKTGTTPVGSFPPNPWGFHDMSGNVWEWTADEHCPYPSGLAVDPHPRCGASLKVIRGGSWYFGADSARCALRYTHRPQDRGFSLGFRLVREPHRAE